MTKKSILLCLLLIGLEKMCFSQGISKSLKKAEELYNDGLFFEAKQKYLEVWKADSTNYLANERLGIVMSENLNEKDQAVNYLANAIRKNKRLDTSLTLVLAYAGCNQVLEKYDVAIEYFNKALTYLPKDKKYDTERREIEKDIENCKYAKENPFSRNFSSLKVRNLGPGVNTIYSEYAPVIVKAAKGLMYTTRRSNTMGGKVDNQDGKYYEDMFYASLIEGKFQNGAPFSDKDPYLVELKNSPDHDAVVSVTSDGKKLFIFKNLGIYESDFVKDYWGTPARLSPIINSPETYEAHAFLCADGKTLYFSSDKEGGLGGLDIYKSVRDAAGVWSSPLNLGPEINTAKDDDSPFMSPDGKEFYFSSKGHSTFGGYDVFKCKVDNEVLSKPENLGTPVNSSGDDIYFSYNEERTMAFFASSRIGGIGEMDLYQLVYFDKYESNCISMKNQNADGEMFFDFISKDSLLINSSFKFDASSTKLKNGIVARNYWKINDSIVSQDTLTMTRKFDKEGTYKITLQCAVLCDTSLVRRDFCVEKTVKVFSPKAVDDFFEPLLKKNEEKIIIKGAADIASVKIDSTKTAILKIKLDPIFFDSDKFTIRKDASKTMDANIAKMKVDPNIIIKITAHTDSKASREYNLSLSQKRANATIAYLGKKGIKKDRILAVVAMGEQELVNDCGDDKKCNELLNQQNRRVEFKIVGSKPKPVKKAKAPLKPTKNSGTTKKTTK